MPVPQPLACFPSESEQVRREVLFLNNYILVSLLVTHAESIEADSGVKTVRSHLVARLAAFQFECESRTGSVDTSYLVGSNSGSSGSIGISMVVTSLYGEPRLLAFLNTETTPSGML